VAIVAPVDPHRPDSAAGWAEASRSTCTQPYAPPYAPIDGYDNAELLEAPKTAKGNWAGRSGSSLVYPAGIGLKEEIPMAWTTPSIIEICIGLEINGYLPAEF
jgi:coenzyme PQQ precursor peptide PqqA